MTDMQLKFMRTQAEIPKLGAETHNIQEDSRLKEAERQGRLLTNKLASIESTKAQEYLDTAWKDELRFRALQNQANAFKALGDKELSRYYGTWWDNKGRGRGWAYHNWWNPLTNTYGVGRQNFNAVAQWFGDHTKIAHQNIGKIGAAILGGKRR